MTATNNQPLCTTADRQSYALTAEQVAIAIAGHDLRTFKGWIAAASSLLADAPLMTGIQEIHRPYVILKAEFNGKPEVVFFYNETNGIYSPDLASDFDISAWCNDSWDGVEAEANIATLTCPDFVTLRHEQLLKQVTNDSLSPGM